MRYLGWAVLVLLAACGQQAPRAPENNAAPPPSPPAAVVTDACGAHATTTWSANGASFSIEAVASGASCAAASVALTVRDAAGAVAYGANYEASTVPPISGAESPEDMQRMLTEWITPAGASMDSTGDLAVWAPGAPEPVDAEVPFHPHDGVTRDAYEALRAADAPMYCYQQDALSGACFVVRDGAFQQLGVQTYAG